MSSAGGSRYTPPSSSKPSAANVAQGGRFANAEQNIKNKANTAQKQKESTFQVLDSKGDTYQYQTQQVIDQQRQNRQEQQQQQQVQQQRQQQQIQQQQEIQKKQALYSGLSDYEGIPQTQKTQYQVTTPDGKVRTFNSKSDAEKFSGNYGREKITAKYEVTTPDGKVRTFNSQKAAEKFSNNYGGQTNISQIQGPSNDVLFVGAFGQGYVTKQPQVQKPLQTGIKVIDNPKNSLEQFAEGLSRPISNFASQTKDFIDAIRTDSLRGPEPFTESSNPFGLPVPKNQTPLKETASSQLFEGKIPDLSKPNILGSAATEIGMVALGAKSGRIGEKLGGKITTSKNQRILEKAIRNLESPKVLTTEKVQKFGPNFPNSGEFIKEVYKKSKFQISSFLKEGKINVKPIKGTKDLFKIESQNPLQDKLVLAKVTKDKISFKSLEPESQQPIEGVRIRTNPKDEFNVELAKFNLEKKSRGIYQTKPKSDLTNIQKAIGSDSVQSVARLREFSLEDVMKNPKAFSRYFFQETTVGKPPTTPTFDISLAETRSFGTVGSKITTYPKTELDIPLRGQSYDMPNIFKAFKEKTVRVGESFVSGRNIRFTKPEYFKKKSILDTFVYDVQRNIKEIDPYSIFRPTKGKKASSYSKGKFKISDDFEPFTKGSGQVLEKSPEQFKKSIEKQIQKEAKESKQDIMFSKPRGLAYTTTQQDYDYGNISKTAQRNKSELSYFINEKSTITKQPNIINEKYLTRQNSKNEFDFGIIPIQQPKVSDILKEITQLKQPQILTPEIITRQTPKQTPKLTPITQTTTKPIITTETVPIITPTTRPEIFPEITPRGGFIPYIPPTFLGSGGYEPPESLSKGYAAYGISSDINIKTLPTYSRYSKGMGIFASQAKEDKKIQDLFYGRKTRKSKGKKGKSKKKSKGRRK